MDLALAARLIYDSRTLFLVLQMSVHAYRSYDCNECWKSRVETNSQSDTKVGLLNIVIGPAVLAWNSLGFRTS